MTPSLKGIKSQLLSRRNALKRASGRCLFDKPRNRQTSLHNLHRIIFVRWDAKLGDSIVSSWIFNALKDKYPAASIEVITSASMAPLFKEYFGADVVHLCPKRASYRQLAQLAKNIGQIDLLVHFSKQLKIKDMFFLRQISCPNVAGLDDELDSINIKFGEKTAGLHFSQKFAALAKYCGIEHPKTDYILPYNHASVERMSLCWPEAPVIAINPYGNSSSRRLTSDNITRLINTLKQTLHEKVNYCLLFSPETKDETIRLSATLPDTFCCKESDSISDLIAQLSLADGVISVDTATIHIAAGLNKPILGLYNPDMENFSEWGPNTEKSMVIFSKQVNPFDINTLPWDTLTQQLESWWKLAKKSANPSFQLLNE